MGCCSCRVRVCVGFGGVVLFGVRELLTFDQTMPEGGGAAFRREIWRQSSRQPSTRQLHPSKCPSVSVARGPTCTRLSLGRWPVCGWPSCGASAARQPLRGTPEPTSCTLPSSRTKPRPPRPWRRCSKHPQLICCSSCPLSSCLPSCLTWARATSPVSLQPAARFGATRPLLRRQFCVQSGRWRRSCGGAPRRAAWTPALLYPVGLLVSCLLRRDRRDAQMRQAPLAVGAEHSIFVDKSGRLLTCGRGTVLGYAVGHPYIGDIGPPTLVPSMRNRRIVSVATSSDHCLALSVEGEVYSWGDGDFGALGHGDEDERDVPTRIESLSRIERIAAGPGWKSAAVDVAGRLFTWGKARVEEWDSGYDLGPSGLGYELDQFTESQPTPKRVDALA